MNGVPADEADVSNRITGGVFFHAVVMGRDIQVTLPAEIRPALTGLPRPAAVFTGRDEQVEVLLAGLSPDGADGPLLVSAVAGMAGVGKTELVVQTAYRALREPGWFPGGVLFVDMFGYDQDRRLPAADALLSWLQAIGIPGEHIPAGVQDRARLWRSVLDAYTSQDSRLLLIIDNAASEDQVTPLLPADPAIAVLVTSRHTLDIDARLHDLHVLDPDAAVTLIREVVAQRRGHEDPRLHAPDQHRAMTDLADLCAGLPLALRVVAALLADRDHLQPAALADRLRDGQARLDGLSRQQVAVRAAFDLSYRHLTDDQALLYRLLPVNPGPDIATDGTAALTDLPTDRVAVLLEDLHRAHLVDEPAADRWRMHDLIRLHAADQPPASPDEIPTARHRLFSQYLHTTQAADTHLVPTGPTATTRFASRQDALRWLDAEHDNLVSVCTSAPSYGLPHITIDLAFALGNFLHFRRHFTDWITIGTVTRDICRQSGDRHGEGAAWNNLGSALRQVRRFDEALAAYTTARDIFRELGDRHGEGTAWNNLGNALQQVRRFDGAIDAHATARDVFRELGDRCGEGTAWNNLGNVLRQVRRFDEAITAHTNDLEICHQLGNRHGEGQAWNNLGLALAEVRRFDGAVVAHTTALDIFRQLGDRYGEGQAWGNLGIALFHVRRFGEAITAHTNCLEICHHLGDRDGEGTAWNNLGNALQQVRRFDEAIDAHNTARDVHRQLGDRHGEARAWNNLGTTLVRVRRFGEAITAHATARDIYRQLGDRHGEAQAWNNLGNALQQVRRFDEAIDAHTAARDICREIGDRHGEAQAWNNLGNALQQVRRFDEAAIAHTTARDVYRQFGDRHGEAGAWNNLGNALQQVRRFDGAIDAYTTARDICREIGDRHGEGQAWYNLGIVLAEVRRIDETRTCWEQAVDAFTETGDAETATLARAFLDQLRS
ncbi:tetratricopeptide repeat protein [Micromonospora sp. NPDC023956]|uniref:tetratricopeptide repeat protein n=1 Tax=Micromonospora sp. NPDC023956 TaxID=3155722 RepID=UPI0033D17B0F